MREGRDDNWRPDAYYVEDPKEPIKVPHTALTALEVAEEEAARLRRVQARLSP